jgi:transposase InsO family protein
MKKPSTKIAARNEPILSRIRELKADHPFWGYRRLWAHLKFVDKLAVNKKRIYRLLREHDLTVKPHRQIKASRVPPRSKPRPTQPNHWWGIDMTKIMVEDFGWLYIVLVLDWYSKKIVGHCADLRSTSAHWRQALDRGLNRQFPEGVRGHELHLMSDNGSQPTSESFMAACSQLGVQQAFTSYNNPKGNADTERMMRTLKEELLWLRDWSSPRQLQEALTEWIERYNTTYLHSSLGYQTPSAYEHEHQTRHITQDHAA